MSHRSFPLGALALVSLAGCQLFAPGAPTPATVKASEAPAATTSTTALYVFNGLGKTIDEIDPTTMTVTKSVQTTGTSPNQFVTSGATTYLVNSGDSNVVSYNLKAHQLLDTFNLAAGLNPFTMAFATPSEAVVMSAYGNHTGLTWANLVTKSVVATASVPNLAWTYRGAAIVNGRVYVPCAEGDYGQPKSYSALKVFDMTTHALVKTIVLAPTANPRDLALDPNGKLEVATDDGVITVDPSNDTVVRTISLGAGVDVIRFVSGTKAYCQVAGGLASFDPSTGAVLRSAANKIAVPAGAPGVFNIFGNAAYVPNFASDSIRVIDLTTETASGSDLAVGDGPSDLAIITTVQ